MLGWALYGRLGDGWRLAPARQELLTQLGLLNLTALLVGTLGGFGALLAVLVSPQIRAYNRICVYLSFFACCVVALFLDELGARFFPTGKRAAAFGLGVILLSVLGVLDLTPRRPLPDFALVAADYQNDAEFFQRVEARAHPAAMIFQLPAHGFPEGLGYDHFKAYLHTRQLRWSYGAMKGRPAVQWQAEVSAQTTPRMLETLAAAGFSGVQLDRWLYKDGGAALEAELTQLLDITPLVSRNQRFSYFDLPEPAQNFEARRAATE